MIRAALPTFRDRPKPWMKLGILTLLAVEGALVISVSYQWWHQRELLKTQTQITETAKTKWMNAASAAQPSSAILNIDEIRLRTTYVNEFMKHREFDWSAWLACVGGATITSANGINHLSVDLGKGVASMSVQVQDHRASNQIDVRLDCLKGRNPSVRMTRCERSNERTAEHTCEFSSETK
jgi:hypothetical protein